VVLDELLNGGQLTAAAGQTLHGPNKHALAAQAGFRDGRHKHGEAGSGVGRV
jgi:hypothetical protein